MPASMCCLCEYPSARREAFVAANRFIINLFLVHI